MAFITDLSQQYGLDEAAIRFLLGQISGFPIFLLYTIFIRKLDLNLHYLYMIVTGVGIAYWSFGIECLFHTVICIVINLLVLNFGPWRGTQNVRWCTATFLVLFQFGYLLVGYWNRVKWAAYDAAVDWTTPHCILSMRLMAMTMDYYDGNSSYNKENPERLKKNFNSITKVPGIFSTLAYIFFIGGYFVGPQYSYKHFIQCLQRNKDEPYDIPLQLVLQKFLLSITLLVLIVACFDPLSTTYVLETEEFHSMSYIKRCFHWVCWGHLVIVKYTMVWTLAEGVVILAGIGYNPNAKDPSAQWTSGENINLPRLMVATSGTSFNKAFNMKTGEWLAYYVFKRLRFFNNIHISQLITMIFVAAWHGLCSGYFVSFGIQGLNLTFERNLFAQLNRSAMAKHITQMFSNSILAKIGYIVFLWGHKLLYTPCVLLGMHTFTYNRYWPIMKSVGAHWIFISYLVTPIVLTVAEKLFRSLMGKSTKEEEKSSEKLLNSQRETNGITQNGSLKNGKIDKVD